MTKKKQQLSPSRWNAFNEYLKALIDERVNDRLQSGSVEDAVRRSTLEKEFIDLINNGE